MTKEAYMKFFTSDIHLGSATSVRCDGRPFKNDKQFEKFIIKTWNKQAKKGDTIYVIGDMFDCHSKDNPIFLKKMPLIKKFKANIVLIMGNNEERIIKYFYNNSFEDFKKVCLQFGIVDFVKDAYTNICGQEFYLTHKPIDHHKEKLTLFGHSHRAMGVYKSFGFHIGCDLNHFRLFSEKDIEDFLIAKKEYWEWDENLKLV